MSKKVKILGLDVETENLNKAAGSPATDAEIKELGRSFDQGKGVNSLSPFYDYFIEGQLQTMPKVSDNGKPYLAVTTIMLNKDTHEAVGRGTVSINMLRRGQVFINPETNKQEDVKVFPQIPLFRETVDSMKAFIENNFKGKVFRATGKAKITPARFVDGNVRYTDEYGKPNMTREVNTYTEIDKF